MVTHRDQSAQDLAQSVAEAQMWNYSTARDKRDSQGKEGFEVVSADLFKH